MQWGHNYDITNIAYDATIVTSLICNDATIVISPMYAMMPVYHKCSINTCIDINAALSLIKTSSRLALMSLYPLSWHHQD